MGNSLSLCSGIGGLDLAFATKPVAFAEIDPAAIEVLAYRFPGVALVGDFTELESYDSFAPDLITGGLPCQPFSTAGKKLGTEDARYLFGELIALIERSETRPIIFLENVAAFALARYAAPRSELLAGFARLGYRTREIVVAAAEVGAPHLRRRWFLAAIPQAGSWESLAKLAEPSLVIGRKASPQLLPTPTANGQSSVSEDYSLGLPGVLLTGRRNRELLPTPTTRPPTGTSASFGVSLPEILLRFDSSAADPKSDRTNPANIPLSADGIRIDPTGGYFRYQAAIDLWAEIIGRPPPERVGLDRPPWLSPAFSEWLMGFPAGFVTEITGETARSIRLLGNAVLPPQASLAAVRLAASGSLLD